MSKSLGPRKLTWKMLATGRLFFFFFFNQKPVCESANSLTSRYFCFVLFICLLVCFWLLFLLILRLFKISILARTFFVHQGKAQNGLLKSEFIGLSDLKKPRVVSGMTRSRCSGIFSSLRFSLCWNKTGCLLLLNYNPSARQPLQKEAVFDPVVLEKGSGLAQFGSHAHP